MSHNIKEGAIFIADAHESENRKEFYTFLQDIKNKKILTPQLFLMGDMFDLLVGKVENCVKKYKKYIKLIDEIAQEIEVFYFEGNHDFCLENIFLHVKVFPIQNQPQQFFIQDKIKVLISHGDKFGDTKHNIYTTLIRSKALLKALNQVDKYCNFKISNKIEKDLLHKNICCKIENFEDIIKRKIKKYYPNEESFILEGHYHQNKQFIVDKVNYINFSSFACNQSCFIVEFSSGVKFAEKQLRGCNV